MKTTMIFLLILGFMAAASAAVLVGAWRADQKPMITIPMPSEEVDVVIASRTLPASTVVSAADVEIKRLSRRDAPKESIPVPEKIVGQVLIAPAVSGQVLTSAHFAKDNSGVRLAAVLPEGMRAMSVTLSDSAALDALLYPGSYVDVLASFQARPINGEENHGPQTALKETLSTTLFENVQVLAVQDRTIVAQEGETSDRASNRRRTVALLVNGKQAEALQLAMMHGQIALVMRNPLDGSTTHTRGTLFSDLSHMYADRLALTSHLLATGDPNDDNGNQYVTMEPPVGLAALADKELDDNGLDDNATQKEDRKDPTPPLMKRVSVWRGMQEERMEFPQEDQTDEG